MVRTSNRDAVGLILGGLNGSIDLIIPRGGKNLIRRVQSEARVPLLSHLEGLCHTYVHQSADIDKALAIIENAKLRRTGVCGATETVLVDKKIASNFVPRMARNMVYAGCEIRGCNRSKPLYPQIIPATDEDFYTEHLAPILNLRIVDDIASAMRHISFFGSGHTDCIISEDPEATQLFLTQVDSAIVMHNSSTQFADGGEFGFGAEIGIATGRLHARGPVGAQHLTSYKYWVEGQGQVRPE